MLADLRRTCGNDPTLFLDKDTCNFACKIPLYESDEMGRPIVRIWDCVQKITLTYSQDEWERKQREEEV
jgi:hypothetical protein